MNITCPTCENVIRLKQKQIYHAGFSNLGFLYCDTCTNILEFSTYNKHYVAIVGEKHPWTLSQKDKRKVETHLKQCSCGGRFRFDLQPKCPYCGGSLESITKDNIHFLEIGDVIDGDQEEDVWI
jgi:uncharacterized C2H2 Zn-finger protein